MSTNLVINHPKIECFELDQELIRKFADDLLESEGKLKFALAVVLTNDEEMQNLNRTYRDKDTPTNVLAFPFNDGEDGFFSAVSAQELGDIIISLDTAIKEAKEYNESFTYRFCWLLTHGFLHLLGMDHEISEDEAEKMFLKQSEMLNRNYPIAT